MATLPELAAGAREVVHVGHTYEEAGLDQVLCYVNVGYLPNDAGLEGIALLGDHVIPESKAMGASRSAEGLERVIALHEAAE